MGKRLRLIGVKVTPQFVLDDGDILTPIPVQSADITAAEWVNIHTIMSTSSRELAARLDAEYRE